MTPFHFQSSVPSHPEDRCVVVPIKISDKAALLDFLRHGIPLPDYFGNNWDALEECLLDLGWMKQRKLYLLHEDIPLQKAPTVQRIYLKVLAAAARGSGRLHVVFPESDREEVTRLLLGEA